jgi:hypothetical protein
LRAQRLLWTSPSLFETAEYHFYGALSHAACCDSAFPDRHQQHFEALAGYELPFEGGDIDGVGADEVRCAPDFVAFQDGKSPPLDLAERSQGFFAQLWG